MIKIILEDVMTAAILKHPPLIGVELAGFRQQIAALSIDQAVIGEEDPSARLQGIMQSSDEPRQICAFHMR